MKAWIVSYKIKGDHYIPGDTYEWQHLIFTDHLKAEKSFTHLKAYQGLNVVMNRTELTLGE